MWKMKVFVVMCLLSFSLFSASGSEASPSEPVNIIVILDTSDRISQQDKVESDIEITTEIVTQFDKLVQRHLKNIPYGESVSHPHRIAFVVPYQPKTAEIPTKIIRQLQLRDPGNEKGYPEFEKQRDALLGEIPNLYNFVMQHPQTGSDIWGWFQDEAKDSLYEGYQNLIICVSDGYLIFDRDIQIRRPKGTCMHLIDGKEKIDMTQPLSPVADFPKCRVKFLMLEIDMKDVGDYENMKTYWNTWLNAIGIQETDFAKKGRWLRKLRSFISAE